MDEQTYWIVNNALNLFGIVVAIGGLTLVYRQIKQLISALSNDAQARLFQQNAELRRIIAIDPDLRKYIFDGEPMAVDDELYPRVRTVAEMYANYLEHLAVLQSSLKTGDPKPWSKVIRDIYQSSPIIRHTIQDKPHWYCSKLHDIVGEVERCSDAGKPG